MFGSLNINQHGQQFAMLNNTSIMLLDLSYFIKHLRKGTFERSNRPQDKRHWNDNKLERERCLCKSQAEL